MVVLTDETDNSCLLDIKAGCGLFINGGNELEVAHDELVGKGLVLGSNCSLDVELDDRPR